MHCLVDISNEVEIEGVLRLSDKYHCELFTVDLQVSEIKAVIDFTMRLSPSVVRSHSHDQCLIKKSENKHYRSMRHEIDCSFVRSLVFWNPTEKARLESGYIEIMARN